MNVRRTEMLALAGTVPLWEVVSVKGGRREVLAYDDDPHDAMRTVKDALTRGHEVVFVLGPAGEMLFPVEALNEAYRKAAEVA